MNQAAVLSLNDRRGQHQGPDRAGRSGPDARGGAELRTSLFSTLRRSDQRKKADLYLSGLLGAEGRKSIRNIATVHGGPAAEQSLHHFICSSTWDWAPMRAELARFLGRTAPHRAWVVRSLAIPKAGTHSVGVGRQFVPDLGQVMNGQLAYGAWFASEGISAPVDWRLFLPPNWLDHEGRRSRAEIPEGIEEATPAQCAVDTGLAAARSSGLPNRPVILDTELGEPGTAVRAFAAAGVPLLARIDDRTQLTVADRALPGSGRGALPARQILESVRGLARPVDWTHPTAPGVRLTALAAAVPVRIAQPASGPAPLPRRDLLLLGEWPDRRRQPSRIWLADLPGVPLSSLLRLSKLTSRVDHDVERVGDRVGQRDYEGRSFPGWHRHMTLVSAAHALAMRTASREQQRRAS
ncbi:IS701 family transposase [Streptomyces sp. NPDC020379]|uniref:IS701 family transposase n=1 Tax=Streptomyces sp. NPDC020379 TaxID=3365071 RepID=UPI0037935FD8